MKLKSGKTKTGAIAKITTAKRMKVARMKKKVK